MLALMICTISFANTGVRFEQLSWSQVKAKAARENKMIFFDAYTTWCGPCKFLDENVYTDAGVAAYFNENYINVKFDMESGEGIDLAEEFEVSSNPTLLFFNSNGELVHKYIGAMKAPEFIQLGKDAREPTKQYYTIKTKVKEGKLGAEDFLNWATLAEELEDSDRGAVASSWLNGQGDILANADLAKAALLYTDLTEEQLSYLYKNQEKIATLLGWDADKVSGELYRKLFTLALSALDENARGADAFSEVVRKFDPSQITYANADLEMLKAIRLDMDVEKASDILVNTIKGDEKLDIKQFCSLLIDHSPRFETEHVQKIVNVLENYQLQAADQGKECWLQIAKVIVYAKSGEMAKAKIAAQAAIDDKNTPSSYRKALDESFSD
jgi:thiol-disulfide isomerase/thioredoxin